MSNFSKTAIMPFNYHVRDPQVHEVAKNLAFEQDAK